jgi:hypothetical protein
VLTLDGYGAVALVDRAADVFSIFKGNAAWLVVIEDGDSAFSVTSNKSVSVHGVVKFNEEIFIGLPTFVVSNLNLNNFFVLARSKVDDLVDGFEIFRSCGGIIAGTDANFSCDSVFVLDSHECVVVSFRDRHGQATEAETVIFLTSLVRADHRVFSSRLAASLDDRLNLTDVVLFAMIEALHNRFAFKDVLKLLQVDLSDAGGAELLLEELAHLLRGGSLFGSSPSLASLLRDEVSENFVSSEWNWGHNGSTRNCGSLNEVFGVVLRVINYLTVFQSLVLSIFVSLFVDSISAVSDSQENKV